MRKQRFVFTRSFIVGVLVTTLMVISLPDTLSASWFTSKKVIDTRKGLPSSGTATLNTKYSGYAYDYGDSARGFPGIEVFVICAACGKSLALERTPVFPPISIRASVPALPGGDKAKNAPSAPGSSPAGNETSPGGKAVPGPEGAGTKEQYISPVPEEEKIMSCVLTTIYFKLDSDVIRDSEMKKIRSDVVGQLKGKRDMKLSVKGYTCELGTKQYNDRLAARRAKAVAKVLEEEGIHLTEVSGEGKCCYVSNALSKNRRSEVLIQPEGATASDLRCEDPSARK